MSDWNNIAHAITDATGERFNPKAPQNLVGGCINQTYRLSDDKRQYFVKRNQAHLLDMFAAEAEGLAEIDATNCIAVPKVICYGTTGQYAYLVLSWFGSATGKPVTMANFGKQLAALHRHEKPQFGWHRNNTIGATPQNNTWQSDWITFWQQQRLGYQLKLAANKGYGGALQQLGKQLLAKVPIFFSNYQAHPSLLHGDLWAGNYAINQHGKTIIFDPAVYYGDREVDIAMTELFGRFPSDFYAAYQAAYPLDAGYSVRKQLYNLYHILNHLNLFGGTYQAQSLRMIEQLLMQA